MEIYSAGIYSERDTFFREMIIIQIVISSFSFFVNAKSERKCFCEFW